MRKKQIRIILVVLGIFFGISGRIFFDDTMDKKEHIEKEFDAIEEGISQTGLFEMVGRIENANKIEKMIYISEAKNFVDDLYEEYKSEDTQEISLEKIVKKGKSILYLLEETQLLNDRDKKEVVEKLGEIDTLLTLALEKDLLNYNQYIGENGEKNLIEEECIELATGVNEIGVAKEYYNIVMIEEYWKKIVLYDEEICASENGINVNNRLESIKNSRENYYEILGMLGKEDYVTSCKKVLTEKYELADKVNIKKKDTLVAKIVEQGLLECESKEKVDEFLSQLETSCQVSSEVIKSVIADLVDSLCSKLDHIEDAADYDEKYLKVVLRVDLTEEEMKKISVSLSTILEQELSEENIVVVQTIFNNINKENNDIYMQAIQEIDWKNKGNKSAKDYFKYMCNVKKYINAKGDVKKNLNATLKECLNGIYSEFDVLYKDEKYDELLTYMEEIRGLVEGNKSFTNSVEKKRKNYLKKMKKQIGDFIGTSTEDGYTQARAILNIVTKYVTGDEELVKYEEVLRHEPWQNAYVELLTSKGTEATGCLLSIAGRENMVLVVNSNGVLDFYAYEDNKVEELWETNVNGFSATYEGDDLGDGMLFINETTVAFNPKVSAYRAEGGNFASYQIVMLNLEDCSTKELYRLDFTQRTANFFGWELDLEDDIVFNYTDVYEEGNDINAEILYREYFKDAEAVEFVSQEELRNEIYQ